MKPKKPLKRAKEVKAWQQKVEKQVKTEKVQLDRPDGKERFELAIRKASKKKS